MTVFFGALFIIGSIALGIVFARTGQKASDIKIICPFCGHNVPYKEYHKMVCTNCHRLVELSDAHDNQARGKKQSNRFFIGFFIGVFLSLVIAHLLGLS